MKKIILCIMCTVTFSLAYGEAYSLTSTDQEIIDRVQGKLEDFSQPKRAVLYNTLNKYLLGASNKDTRGYVLFSKIVPLIYDELNKQQGHGAPSNADLNIKSIESKNTLVQVRFCDTEKSYEGFVDIILKNGRVTKSLRYYLHPNNHSADACEIAVFSQSLFTDKASEKQTFTAELKIAETGSSDPDLTNNTKTTSLTISATTSKAPSYSGKGSADLSIQKIELYPQTDDVIVTVCMDGPHNDMVVTRLYSNNRMFNVQRYEINEQEKTKCFEFYVDGFQFLFVPGRTYVFEARVDPLQKHKEPNENNNYMKTTLFIPAFISFADGMIDPDFFISKIEHNSKQDTVDVEVCHEGGSYDGDLYTKIEANGIGKLFKKPVIVRTNQTWCYTESIARSDLYLKNGVRYAVVATTDLKRNIQESDEDNNVHTEYVLIGNKTTTTSSSTSSSSTEKNVDLSVKDVSYDGTTQKLIASICVSNKDYAGYNHVLFEADNGSGKTLGVYVNIKQDACQDVKMSYRDIGLSLNHDYDITATIDPNQGVIESDEDNNSRQENVTIDNKGSPSSSSAITSLPDLYVKSLEIVGHTASSGGVILRASYCNKGPQAINSQDLSYGFDIVDSSTNRVTDTLIDQTIPVGSCDTLTIDPKLKRGLTSKLFYQFVFMIDYKKSIDEASESNNSLTKSLYINYTK